MERIWACVLMWGGSNHVAIFLASLLLLEAYQEDSFIYADCKQGDSSKLPLKPGVRSRFRRQYNWFRKEKRPWDDLPWIEYCQQGRQFSWCRPTACPRACISIYGIQWVANITSYQTRAFIVLCPKLYSNIDQFRMPNFWHIREVCSISQDQSCRQEDSARIAIQADKVSATWCLLYRPEQICIFIIQEVKMHCW